jgi:antitoxin component YwqK of YwqJK toxin-antitoxin module
MSKLFRILMSIFVPVFCVACSDDGWKSFEIEGAIEDVQKTFPDGRHQVSYFFKEDTGEKVEEVEFHPNGQPKIHKHFEQNVLNGESWCYYEDGKTWSLNNFKDGGYHGVYKTWYPNGQLHQLGNYLNGKKTGEWITYYANGGIDTQGYYLDDRKAGVWTSFNQQGVKMREQNFVADADSLTSPQ